MKVYPRGWAVAVGLVFYLFSAGTTQADSLIRADLMGEVAGRMELQVICPGYVRVVEFDHRLDALKAPESNPRFSTAAMKTDDRLFVHGYPEPVVSVSQNPEPATMVLLGSGLAGLGALMRKRRHNRKSPS